MAVTDGDAIFLWGTPPPTNLNELSLRGVAVTDSEDSDFGENLKIFGILLNSRPRYMLLIVI